MIHHASYELREAIEGVPPAGIDREGADPFSEYELPACGDSLGQTSKAALAYLWRGATDVEEAEWFEDPTPIDCPDCLRLLERARGPERTAELLVYADQLEGVVAAHTQAISDLPTCDCGGPMASVRRAAAQLDLRLGVGMKHRVLKESHALFCERCYHGRHDSERAVRAAELPEDLEPAAYAAAAKLATIRAANLFVPGESAARRKTA